MNRKYVVAGTCSLLFLSLLLMAQTPPAAPPQPGPGNAGAANGGIDSVKPLIKATDEEWKVIGPKLQAVVTARQAVMTYTANAGRGGFGPPGTDSFAGPLNGMGRGGRGGFGGPGGPGALGAPNAAGAPNGPGGADAAGGRGGGPDGGGRGPGGPGGPGGRGGGPGGGPGGNNVVSTALAELKTALADTSSTPEQIKVKIESVRKARQRAAADLAAAQKNLLPLLTADQEATLVSLGYLD